MEFDGNWLRALALFFFISDYHLRSATDKQQAGLVSVKSSFFFSLKSRLHQLSVMSCQESCSSKECIKAPVPTLHFTSQHDHCTTGVLSLSVFHFSHSSWQILNHIKNILCLLDGLVHLLWHIENYEIWPYSSSWTSLAGGNVVIRSVIIGEALGSTEV